MIGKNKFIEKMDNIIEAKDVVSGMLDIIEECAVIAETNINYHMDYTGKSVAACLRELKKEMDDKIYRPE